MTPEDLGAKPAFPNPPKNLSDGGQPLFYVPLNGGDGLTVRQFVELQLMASIASDPVIGTDYAWGRAQAFTEAILKNWAERA